MFVTNFFSKHGVTSDVDVILSRQAYHAAVQTGREIEWHCDSCAVELSSLPGEPVAASSRLENIDSRESHLEQGSTVGK